MVITGASSGIGAATAAACARAGMDLVLNARRADRLAQVAERVRALGRQVELVAGDVTESGLSERLLDVAEQRFGRFDVVFANAGYGVSKPLHELSEAELRRLFDVNFFAATDLLCQAARRLMAAGRPGHLLMCSSSAALFPLPEAAAYSASKAAQNHVCMAMRQELRPYGIEVSAVYPITTRTEFFTVAARLSGQPIFGDPVERYPRWFVQSPERVAQAVVRGLRRPRPQIWTSKLARVAGGLLAVFPGLLDLAMKLRKKRRE
jgi:short-subunit dehydrogenase